LSKSTEASPIRLALNIGDRALADRLAALLAEVPGLQLVGASEPADVTLVCNVVSASTDGDIVLTPRELEVLTLLAEGMSNKAIARRLGISVHTAKFHVGALIDKLDAVGRTDAVAHAARRGVIHLWRKSGRPMLPTADAKPVEKTFVKIFC
jgi:DNA-binding CsgD family transcriptional regulator